MVVILRKHSNPRRQDSRELRAAINNTYGRGAAPDILLIGVDTDIGFYSRSFPDAIGDIDPDRYIDSGKTIKVD